MRQAEAEAAGAVVPSISATRNSQNAVPAYDDDDAPEPRASFFIGPSYDTDPVVTDSVGS